jgi:MFS family permease
VHRYVPESPIRTPSRVDVPGALLLSAALVALLVGLTEGEHWGWTSAPVVGLALAAVVLFVVWAVVELRTREPLVDMRMLAHRPVLLTNVTTMISGFALFSCFVLVPTFVQAPESRGYGFGATATEAGLFLLPGSLAILVSGPLAGLVGRRYGPKWPLAAGMLGVSVAATLLAFAHDEPWQVVVANVALGLGVGAAFAAMVALIAENVDPREMGIATGMNTVVRLVGAVVGGQVGAALLTALTIGNTSAPSESAFTWAFALGAVAALAAAGIAVAITRQPLRRMAHAPA